MITIASYYARITYITLYCVTVLGRDNQKNNLDKIIDNLLTQFVSNKISDHFDSKTFLIM